MQPVLLIGHIWSEHVSLQIWEIYTAVLVVPMQWIWWWT